VLKQTKLDTNQIKIIGFGLKKMTVIKKNFSEYEVFLNRRISLAKVIYRKSYWDNFIIKLKKSALDGVNLSYTKSLNTRMVEKFRLNNLKIFIWTVNTPKKVLHLINLAVDGFMSDHAGWIREKVT
ncbi:MAG TPA: glycerophosphodiester phosphodiesterase family protein, partial [Ignavibacteriaceae bacterium]